MYQSSNNEWETPQELFDALNGEFQFTLDPAATAQNAKCKKYYTKKENGLTQSWGGEVVFCNPPYGRSIKDWVKKAYEESRQENTTVVLLIPARTDTIYWHDYIHNLAEIRYIRGRLRFSKSKNTAPFPSAIVIYSKNKDRRK